MQINEVTTPINLKKNEIGLMTKDEFIKFRNPDGKHHSSDAYDFTILSLNRDYSLSTREIRQSYYSRMSFNKVVSNKNGAILYDDNIIVGIVAGDILYYNDRMDNPKEARYEDENIKLSPSKFKRVKYISDYIPLVSNVAKTTRDEHPVLLNRFLLKDKYFEIRTEVKPYEENSGKTIIILNDVGEIVAMAADEWGATLFSVAQEYRGFGLGKRIGKVWDDFNPDYKSGGFTASGEQNAISIWEDRVREFLANGWYTELVKTGKITKEKLKQILSDLSPKRKKPETPVTKNKEKSFLIHVEDNYTGFILYDKAFFEEQDKKYVYGFGFLRGPEDKTHFFKLDYDRQFQKMTTYIALQLAKEYGVPLYVAEKPSDILELDNIDNLKFEGDYVELTKDLIDLDAASRVDKAYRAKYDQYDEIYYQLQEIANSKWD